MVDATLPAKPGAPPNNEKVEAWLLGLGAVPVDGTQVYGTGEVRFSLPAGSAALRDAVLAAWTLYDPNAPTPAEIEDERRRVEALALLDKLDRAPTTVTIAELRRAVLYSLRRALRV